MNACIYKFICCRFPGLGAFLIRDLYHREADDLFADLEALLEDLCNDVFTEALVLDVHDGVVAVGVKRFADGFDLRHAELIERGVILVHDALDALAGGVIVRSLCQCARQAVVHRQELFERLAADIGIDVLALARAASAEVVIFGEQAEVFVLFRREIGLDLFFRLFLFLGLFGFLGGFGLFFLALLLRGLLVRLFFGVRRDRFGLYVVDDRLRLRGGLLRGICFRDYPFGKMVNQMAVAGRGFAFGVVFPDECFGCYFRNYCHGKRENGGRGCE